MHRVVPLAHLFATTALTAVPSVAPDPPSLVYCSLAYFPANSSYESILADIYAGAISNPGFNWLCSPACTELEVRVMDWVGQMIGLDSSFLNSSGVGGGVMTGSASESW